ncbi:MAG: sodium ion-translocating decarboxylase subunit beta, partial [Nitrospinota bacterium]
MESLGSSLVQFLGQTGVLNLTWAHATMLSIGGVLVYLAIYKEFEPLLLLPIGIGAVLSNLPLGGMFEEGGLLYYFYVGVKTGVFPPLIFLGIGALTDFGPLLANPKTILLGAAAQFGIFGTLLGALALGFDLPEASSIGIIGGADGPTAIYLTSKLAPHLLGPVAVAAYSYMALVPIIQPPIMRALTSPDERKVVMVQRKPVSKAVRVLFPIVSIFFTGLLLPSAAPLVGMLMLGNLFRECGVVDRLLKTSENELLNIVTILLGLSVGASMTAARFLNVETLFIIVLGFLA